MKNNREASAAFRKMKMWFCGAQISLCVSVIALLIFPFLGNEYYTELPLPHKVNSAVFWSGLLGELVFYIMAACYKRKYLSAEGAADRGLVGFLAFFRNKEGTIADIFMCLAILVLLISILLHWNNFTVVMIIAASVYLTVQLHSMLNGKIYRVTREKKSKGKGEKHHDESH